MLAGTASQEERWYTYSAEEVISIVQANPVRGLSSEEARRRLDQHGPNELQAPHRVSPLTLFLEQFKNVLIIILLIAAALSAFLGHTIESAAIAVIVLFAVFLGFVQEYRAERAMEALQRMAAPTAHVLRDGEEGIIPTREIVPGDMVSLHAGDRIPADLRMLEAVNLQVDESVLTGESIPVVKDPAPLKDPHLALGERSNIAFSGTSVTYGRGRGVVVATGMLTEFGKVAQLLQTVKSGRTPLQENLDKVGHQMARAALVVVILIVALGLLREEPLLKMLIFGIALAVAVVPEALPAVVTISLAIGVQRMAKRNALVRRLHAVETLGSTSIICSDKTGTLTKNEMTVRRIYVTDKLIEITGAGYEPKGEILHDGKPVAELEAIRRLLKAAVLSSDAILQHDQESRWHIQGDPTEGALVVAAAKAGLHKQDLDAEFPRVNEIPFTSETKRMTTLHSTPSGAVAYSKGAPEIIVESCTMHLTTGGERLFNTKEKELILSVAKEMASQALRVLAVAYKPRARIENAEREMFFLGLIGMIDPPRPEAKDAVRRCKEAGIKVVMITGDHPVTGETVARELGILNKGLMLTGTQLDAMSDEEFERQVLHIEVYARVSPQHKLRIVSAFQNHGEIVAMTGDGVNDAPALKKADIGIAMGITGTDVTKEASVVILTDDNFASIVAAVEEGRGIYGNIKKYLMYLLSSNLGEILLMTCATLIGLPFPLTAVQILYVNLATDGLPALALSVDPPEEDLMHRPPRKRTDGIFTRPVTALMLAGGLWSAIVNIGIFSWALHSRSSIEEAMTMTFVSLVLIQFFKAYNFRSDHQSVLHKPSANKWLNWAVIWELMLLTLIVYLPFLHRPFQTFSLTFVDCVIILSVALTVLPVLETIKWMIRRGWFSARSS